MGIEYLNHIFNPKSVAVIGASERANAIGAKILSNLINAGFKGSVFPVNPSRQTVQGLTAYPNITRIPSRVDLAVIATPAHTVPQIVAECGEAGVLGIIIISAGFKEAGPAGAELEKQILELRKKHGIRIIGANSFGVIRQKINLYATFADKQANSGKIAFISQSAALCASALDWAWEAQIGFSTVVSTGSMLDVDLADLIDYFGADPETRSIVLYVESIKNARKFMSAARGFARTKPIVLVKAGRFKESLEAAFSHSGALGGEDAVYDAAFKRAGIIRVEAIRDLFNCAEALAMQPTPAAPNLTIVTNAGGPAIMATDNLIARGGKLTQLSAETISALKRVLPAYCTIANPVDVYEEANAERFRSALEICIKDAGSGGFLVVYTPQGATEPFAFAEAVADVARQVKKPVLTAVMGEDSRCRDARKLLQRNKVPSFATAEEAVSVFMHMYAYAQNLALLYETPEELQVEPANTVSLRRVLRRAFCEGRKVLTLPESMLFLEEYQIPTVKTLVARTREEAAVLASELGYPVVMKALSPQITHKAKVGGVKLDVCSPHETTAFFDELASRIKNYSAAEFQGVAIQPMIRERGYELLIGSKRDVQFGSVIVLGMGGSAAEFFRDVAVGFPPLSQVLARRLIEDSALCKRALASGSPLNVKVLEAILVKFSQLITDFPEVREVDVNPLIVNSDGAVAVDARLVLDWERMMREVAEHQDSLAIAAYPKKYIAVRELKNGARVLLRPVKPEDEKRFNEFLMSLSEETMRFRFFQILKEWSHDVLTRYCNLDYDREVAIVAEPQQDPKRIIGAGRVITEPDGRSGEFAVLVGDEWQGLGLGLRLMDYIVAVARDMRLERIFGYVSAYNYKMLRMCAKIGFDLEPLDEETVKLVLTLS
ncbi:MAG: bifunctional acetate--CoA ligase family protein/GNAT family N-acetyltransferase [Candidatus Bathyarchaeota archaeon]|nr:bifunctional acetate--CoA ligase family protein/GNAT family N-acetyltransferase [Candidatus Bathyarchaeota archaeon]